MKTESFRVQFEGVSSLGDSGKNSKITFCHGLPWYVHIRTECSDRTGNEKRLGAYFYCNEEDTSELWSCEIESTVTLVHRGNGPALEYSINACFKAKCGGYGVSDAIDWESLLNPDTGYIENDSIILDAAISVKQMVGIPKSLEFDFTQPGFGQDNIALIIEGKKVFVDKKYLALHSDVFKAMFFGEYAEKDKQEIELNEVCYEEFLEFLYVIYPSYKIITYDSYEFILALADKYQVQTALNAGESYLIKTIKLTTMQKLTIADRFRLKSLTVHCMGLFKTNKEIKAVESQLASLSDATKAAIMHRMLELTE